MDIHVDNLSYVVSLDNGNRKQLLHSVTATFPKGVVNVLMGHSGAGKVLYVYVCVLLVMLLILVCGNSHHRQL